VLETPVPEFRILGPLEVVDEGTALALGGQKQRALLAVLLINAGTVVSTDRLINDLWGEQPPRTAMTALQNLVSQLRKILPRDALVTQPPGYRLELEENELDLARVEGIVASAERENARSRSQLLREALTIWRGPPLTEFAYESFAGDEIRRLEELRLRILEERIDADLELGGGPELVGELEGLVRSSPLRERLRGQLMLALYRAGRQAEALGAYHDARTALVDELGIEPSPALQKLYRSMLRQEPVLDRAATSSEPRDDHLGDVVGALLGGRLVTVVGAGVNAGMTNGDGLPGPAEVTAHLVDAFNCPPEYARDLAHVAEYVTLTSGVGPLYDELHALYDREFPPRPVDRALARVARLLREHEAPNQLIVTTNFDNALERAFAEAGEECDVVTYVAVGRNRGKFLHLGANGSTTVVEVPNAYAALSLESRSVILKIHGGIDTGAEREWESFVVSEDDHIDHLAQAEISVVVPVAVAARLRRSHFLFLGYPLHAWSLRVFLHRVWGRERVGYRSWAIGHELTALEQELWRERGIESFDIRIDDYLGALEQRIVTELGG
jgi:DNA-binding SARP family transcriptional activator